METETKKNHPTFWTNEEYWRWYEKKMEEKIIDDYFPNYGEDGY